MRFNKNYLLLTNTIDFLELQLFLSDIILNAIISIQRKYEISHKKNKPDINI